MTQPGDPTESRMPAALRFMLAARQSELQGLESLAATGQLVRLSSQLIHALQKERGYSNIYLASQDGQRRPRLDEFAGQAQALEQRLRQCLEAFDSPGTSAADRARFYIQIAYVLQSLDDLPGLRRRIREYRSDVKEASAAFTRLIGGLLSMVFEAADNALDPEITETLVALFNFMQGKELSGQERAEGVAGFSTGYFDGERLAHMQLLTEGQERCFDLFCRYGPAGIVAHWQATSTDAKAQELGRLRALAQRTSSEARVDPGLAELWFDLATTRIDDMIAIEDELTEELLRRCQESITRARADLANHRAVLRRLAGIDRTSGQALLYGLQDNAPGDAPQDGVGQRLGRSILDLVQEQNTRLDRIAEELKEARASLDERRIVERAKKRMMRQYRLSEGQAHSRLQRAAMEHGLRLPDIARKFLAESETAQHP